MPRPKKTTFTYQGKLSYGSRISGSWQVETKRGNLDLEEFLGQFKNKQIKITVEVIDKIDKKEVKQHNSEGL